VQGSSRLGTRPVESEARSFGNIQLRQLMIHRGWFGLGGGGVDCPEKTMRGTKGMAGVGWIRQ
jgi:hypothetical protein